jgi:hypothetical protein
MTPKITIISQNYFEYVFYYFGWACLIFAIPISIIIWYVGVIALILGIILTTTSYRLVIDSRSNRIEDCLFFLGMKSNSTLFTYKHIHHISIKSGTYSQQLNYKSVSTTVEGIMYSAYLLADDQNHFLGDSKSKKRITEKAIKIAKNLNADFIDL